MLPFEVVENIKLHRKIRMANDEWDWNREAAVSSDMCIFLTKDT